MRLLSLYGYGSSKMPYTTLNIAVVAPMPNIRDRMAVMTKPGDLRNWRKAKRRSCSRVHMRCLRNKDTDLDEICFRRIDELRKDLQVLRLLASPIRSARRSLGRRASLSARGSKMPR